MGSFIDHTDQQKKSAGADAVIYHLQKCALKAFRIKDKYPQHHKAHMTDTGIGHQFFHVLLGDGDPGPV